jgi:hypothetical protein
MEESYFKRRCQDQQSKCNLLVRALWSQTPTQADFEQRYVSAVMRTSFMESALSAKRLM